MGAIAPIILPDAAATPVNHTFGPSSVKGDKGNWANQASSLPIGFELIGATLLEPSGNSTVYRLEVVMKVPILKTTTDVGGNSVTTVDYWVEGTATFKIPQRSTLQNRKDFRKMFAGLLADAQIVDMFENLKHVY